MESDKKQIEKFGEAAREAGCDTSEEAFEEALRRVASSSSRKKDQSGGPEAPDWERGKE